MNEIKMHESCIHYVEKDEYDPIRFCDLPYAPNAIWKDGKVVCEKYKKSEKEQK